jgi:hypothetical protein
MGASFPILLGGMPGSLHRHPHLGKNHAIAKRASQPMKRLRIWGSACPCDVASSWPRLTGDPEIYDAWRFNA